MVTQDDGSARLAQTPTPAAGQSTTVDAVLVGPAPATVFRRQVVTFIINGPPVATQPAWCSALLDFNNAQLPPPHRR